MRLRKITLIGGTHYISIYKQDLKDFDLIKGDHVDIDDIVKYQNPKQKRRTKK